ncbi:spore germination protein [Oikeobacillus pervagus]|uniref:Spore germination protein n=1 Tax=Oikeobacillus pervagus TaxID=1325931 RepID=A0AAJ1WJB6_9BACI|nr:LysM peptidoglycan-binding domain-containing protein [Oikeobacillus pervagus]MDQ0213961.1 spore germination protein [Oikeobacillus pervagus]
MSVHTVQHGDTLWAISNKHQVPMPDLLRVNGLRDADELIPGLALYLPRNHITDRYYSIVAGDTLWRLAIQFQTDISTILQANPGMNPYNLQVGQKIVIPSPLKNRIKTLGFIVPTTSPQFLRDFSMIAQQLTYVAIVAYSFTEEGNVFAELDDTAILVRSKQINVIPLLMIRNFTKGDFDRELVGNVLKNPVARTRLVQAIVSKIRQKGYGGVSIDFEFIPPPRRKDFNIFLRELKNVLGSLTLHVNVHSKTEDIPTNPIIGAYDYKEIGKIADIVAVMTIDYGYPTGPPNPISPLWWVEEVIRYSISEIDPQKLQIAMPLYGYDWTLPTNLTRGFSVLFAQNFAITSKFVIQYDIKAASPYYEYWVGKDKHIVWFEDIRSYIEKYKVIDLYNLLGATYWQISLPFPQNWEYLKQNMIIQKT